MVFSTDCTVDSAVTCKEVSQLGLDMKDIETYNDEGKAKKL